MGVTYVISGSAHRAGGEQRGACGGVKAKLGKERVSMLRKRRWRSSGLWARAIVAKAGP